MVQARIVRTEDGKKQTGYISFGVDDGQFLSRMDLSSFLIESLNLHGWWKRTQELIRQPVQPEMTQAVLNIFEKELLSSPPEVIDHAKSVMQATIEKIGDLLLDRKKINHRQMETRKNKAHVALENWMREALKVGSSPNEIRDILKLVTIDETMQS